MFSILKSVGGRRREISGNVDSVIFMSDLAENVGVEVEIASLSQAVQNVLPLPFLRPPSWIFGRRRRILFGNGTTEMPVGVNIRFMSLTGRWAKLEGCKFALRPLPFLAPPPPLFALQVSPAVRG